jgi:hypothetical protein
MITFYTELENMLQFTINTRKPHGQPQWTLQLMCEDRVFFVSADLHIFVRGQQDPNARIHWKLKNINISNLSLFTVIHSDFEFVDVTNSMSVAIQNQTHVRMKLFSHNDR